VNDHIDDDKGYECPVLKKMETMLYSSIKRAQVKNMDNDLTLDHLFSLYIEVCPILGININWRNCGHIVHGSPSLDRVNNKKGYTQGNVQIISHRANSIKRDYLLVEWEKMKSYMEMCDENPIVITEKHFNEPCQLSERQQIHIRGALKRNENIVQISKDHEVTIGQILKLRRTL